ncbi:redoxin domain-containing protein [Streptococcus castoreus]|uniref:TlpA disulfide reductase family protein n=1 Tax=Streptococcus castoreus TaxID=254786 RepID=UPI0004298DC2|nr:TlpA disulfide reductase family protein [Streptococcus castoreus]
MKKSLRFIIGLACLSLLTACSTQDKMTKTELSKDKKSLIDKKKDKMSTKDSTVMTDKKTDKMVNKGPLAADFELKAVDGKTYRLSDFRGKKVYLKFWASWCSICLSTLADTEALAKQTDKDYVVLTVVSPGHKGEKNEANFKKWFAGTEYKNLPVLLDPDGKLLNAYGVRSYPTEVFIGSDGVLAKKHIGYAKKSDIEKNLKAIK